jgi:hypothetical protein
MVRDHQIGEETYNYTDREKCIYFDMNTKQSKELPKLAEHFKRTEINRESKYFSDISVMCCSKHKIYWCVMKSVISSDINELIITEYDIDTEKIVERVHISTSPYSGIFKRQKIDNRIGSDCEMFISRNYLYLNKMGAFYDSLQSWRFSLDTWEAEQLKSDGDEWKYIQSSVNKEGE